MPWYIKSTLHIIFWIIYCVFAAVLGFHLEESSKVIIEMIDVFILNGIWAAIVFYFMYLWGFRLFEQKKYFKYIVITVLVSVFVSLLFYLLYREILFKDNDIVTIQHFVVSLPGTFILANCGSLLKGFVAWFDAVQDKSELERTSLRHELEVLKSQMNPHFLFNTLNNIDSLIYTAPDKASISLVKLSEILRHMLYDSKEKFVSLQNEVTHLENIIELQKLRHTSSEFVEFINTTQNVHIKIAPLLLTPFIENAFKYAERTGDNPVIKISLSSSDTHLIFKCVNYYNAEKLYNDRPVGGIGLENVRRRLMLLYPDRHNLQIAKEKNIFEVKLKIAIN